MNTKLSAIGDSWFDEALRSIRSTASACPDAEFYAAAFHMFYSDGQKILPPVLAMNDRESLAQSEDPEMDKWSPPEWCFDVIDSAYEAMTGLYDVLSGDYANMTKDQQTELEREHDQMIGAVCRKLTWSIRSKRVAMGAANLSDDFLVVILDYQRDGVEADHLVRMSVDEQSIRCHPDILG